MNNSQKFFHKRYILIFQFSAVFILLAKIALYCILPLSIIILLVDSFISEVTFLYFIRQFSLVMSINFAIALISGFAGSLLRAFGDIAVSCIPNMPEEAKLEIIMSSARLRDIVEDLLKIG